MDVTLGIAGRDFVVLAADMLAGRSILNYKHDEEKTVQIDTHQVLAVSGDQSSRVQFSDYISRNLALMKLRNGRSLSNHAAANFIRSEVAEALRSRGAFQANCLFGSFDEREGPGLYFMDYLGTMKKVPYTAQGYAQYFSLGIFDENYKEDMTEKDAVDLIKTCIDQLAVRFLINMPKFKITILNEAGIVQEVYNSTFKEVNK
eukprot:snap_masked-scaffold_47-processed-gene-0.5-mRNA-1 protein AED:0.09 eAED:0.09 QI:0/-1/0/1/-1/1/1/0/202